MFDRNSFLELVKSTDKPIIVKFSATWCAPCKAIKSFVDELFKKYGNQALCMEIDIDESVDLYAFLRMRKMVNGVPTILCYHEENESIYPDDSISGTNKENIEHFFKENIN